MKIRDGQVDVAILAGPRIKTWPTQGVRVLSRHCSDAGLKVAWYGGPDMQVRGVLPSDLSGGVVMVEDSQKRLHRIQAKALIKISPELEFPIPFSGWYSPGLIPESTARKLLTQGSLNWQPVVVILGTGNRAFQLGAELLEMGHSSRVICIESIFKEVQGWDVERRRFEMKGGKIIFGKPLQLLQKSPFIWEIKVQDDHGVRVIDAARVISVGPFEHDVGFREYPPGSFLIEWENTESSKLQEDVEKILLDEHRAVVLASRLIKGLMTEPASEAKSNFEKQLWLSKQKLKEMEMLPLKRFRYDYDGKWLSVESKNTLLNFGGTPKRLDPERMVAAIDCIENIGCRICQKACPVKAIQIDRPKNLFLLEDVCTGCGFCLQACPSEVPIMIAGDASQSFTTLVFTYRESKVLKKGEKVGLLSRKGELLAQGRVLDLFIEDGSPLYKVEVPSHLVWDVRSILAVGEKQELQNAEELFEERGTRIEVQIQGDVRRVREGQNVSVSLFEIGMARPNDILICEDGACGLCQIEVDGVRKFACQTTQHQGMSIRFTRDHRPSSEICPCQGIKTEDFESVISSTRPDSIEALTQVCEVGQGKCHGLLCKKSWVRQAGELGVGGTDRYADWRFPWVDWLFK
jgi:ferredoxin